MNESEALFINTLDDIGRRLLQNDPYKILMIAGLIRKLFLDDSPLVDQVNRTYRLSLDFEIAGPVQSPDNDPHVTFWTIQDGLDPDTAPPFKPHFVIKRDRFFRTVVTVVNGHSYTIKDIVLFEANVMGGIHAGSPKTEKESSLKRIDSSIAVGGYRSSLRQLKAVARVILKSLEPLRRAINAT